MRRKILAAALTLVLATTAGSDGGGNCVEQLGQLGFISLKQQRTGGNLVLRIYFNGICPIRVDRGASSDCVFIPRVKVVGYPFVGAPVVLNDYDLSSRTLPCGSSATPFDINLNFGTPCGSGNFRKVVFSVTLFPGKEAYGRGTTWTQTLDCLATTGSNNPGPTGP